MHAEYFESDRHHPVNERRLFQIRDAIETSRHPVSRGQHGAGDLCLNGIDVIHQPGRTNDAYEEDEASRGEDDPTMPATAASVLAGFFSSTLVVMFHRFIQMNRTSNPHR